MPFNFAYGSNMHPDRLRGRADCRPSHAVPATLCDWRLAFNLATGIALVEPAMANIVPAPGQKVHGVALELTTDELERLVESEGGDRFYRVRPVTVETYDGQATEAVAFVARDDFVRNEVAPSKRYLDLLRAGARHHGLDEAYCAFLDDHATAPPSPLAPWFARLFRTLDRPSMRGGRDAFLQLVQRFARLEARRNRP